MKADNPPPVIVTKTEKGLKPATSYDAEMLMGHAVGTEYELVPISKRSWPQLKLYWTILNRVVKATQRWPTAEHLSNELKFVCGFRQRMVDWEAKKMIEVPDSIALSKMSKEEFRVFFDMAMLKLSEATGIDMGVFLDGEHKRH